MFPSARPDRREDVALLAHWMTDMVAQLSAHEAQALLAQVRAWASAGGPPEPKMVQAACISPNSAACTSSDSVRHPS